MPNPLSAYGVSDRDYAAAIGTAMGEANREGVAGMAAVMDVMSNRLANPGAYGATDNSLAGVAYGTRRNGMQFDTWNSGVAPGQYKLATWAAQAALDPSKLAKAPPDVQQQFEQAQEAAFGVLSPEGDLRGITQGATFYGNTGLMSAARQEEHARVGNALDIGNHTFRGADLSLSFDRDAALQANANAYQSFKSLGLHEPATGLTIPSPTSPFDTWGDAGRAEVAAGQFGNIRGLNDFGAPVQTSIPESEQRANDLMGGVPDFGMIDAATPATPLDASPVGGVERGPDLADLSVGPSGVSGAWDGPREGSYGVSGDFAPGYDPLGSISAPSAGVEQNANYNPLSSIQAPDAPATPNQQAGAFGNKDVYDTASDPFSGMMGAPWAGGATGEWDGVPNGSFGVSGAWAAPDTNYSWSGPLADRASPVSYTTPATGDYGYSPTDGYSGGSDYGNPGRGLSPGGPMVGGWQGPSPQDYTGDMGFHGVPQQGYTPTPTVSPYGFSGLDLGTGTGVGGFLSGSPYGVTPSSNSNAGFGWAMSPSGWSGFDVSGGYSGGSFDGSPGYGITPTAPATTYQPSAYTSVPDTPDVQQSVASSVSRPATTYQTVVQKTLNPDWTAYQAQQQEAPATPTLDTTFGAVPSMVGDLGYVSDLGATNVTPQKAATAPPKYITQTVKVPIEAPAAIAAPGKKPKAQAAVDKQAQAAAQWAKDTTLAASDARINATLAANRPIIDPLTGQTLIDAQQPGVMDKIAQAIKGVLPGWAPATPTYTGDVRSGTGAYNAGGWGSYGMNASQIADRITAGRMAPGPLGLGNGYAGTGYTINDIAANYYNGGLGGGVQVGGSNWAGNQGGLGGGWMGNYSGSINGSGGYNGNHGGFNGTGGLY